MPQERMRRMGVQMRSRTRLWTALLVVGAAGSAWAVKPGGTLYVKARTTRLMKGPSATGDALAILQPPTPVRWEGPDPKHKQWHRVTADGRTGFVFQSNLATRPPSLEVVAGEGAGKVDAKAFANSGAAVKAVSSGVIAMGEADPDTGKAVAQLQALEQLARGVQDAQLAAHAKEAGLKPVVGAASGGAATAAGGAR
jgi:hypothetical protein